MNIRLLIAIILMMGVFASCKKSGIKPCSKKDHNTATVTTDITERRSTRGVQMRQTIHRRANNSTRPVRKKRHR